MTPSQHWFEDLVEQTHSGLARYIGRILISADDVQEVIQEAYLKIYIELRRTGSDGNLPVGLLYATARNIAISRLRHQKVVSKSRPVVAISEELRTQAVSAEQEVSVDERRRALLQTVNGLAPKCRQVFVLRWIEGLSHRDIAERLGISVSTVEKHLAKGLRHCKNALASNPSLREELVQNRQVEGGS